jgi:quinol monooxygenase YgiN
MSVLVQFRVAGADPARFRKAVENMPEFRKEPGFLAYPGAYTAESDPNEVTELELWESHDHMHAASEKWGERFNEEAGTEGLEWDTRIWHRVWGEDLRPVEEPNVIVAFRVRGVADVDRFTAAAEKWRGEFEAMGARNSSVYTSEADPNEVGWFTEWDSHDQMMESSERHGEAFQSDAGTQGLDWETRIWHRLV